MWKCKNKFPEILIAMSIKFLLKKEKNLYPIRLSYI